MSELAGLVGQELGPTRWIDVTQERIDAFAGATGDPQWIHVDPERAERESPFGTTIAHGFLTLSLCVPMLYELLPPAGTAASTRARCHWHRSIALSSGPVMSVPASARPPRGSTIHSRGRAAPDASTASSRSRGDAAGHQIKSTIEPSNPATPEPAACQGSAALPPGTKTCIPPFASPM